MIRQWYIVYKYSQWCNRTNAKRWPKCTPRIRSFHGDRLHNQAQDWRTTMSTRTIFYGTSMAYSQYEYALQDFLQYVKKTFVSVGDAFIPGNSPAKGYRQSNVRLLFEKMGRRRGCTVYFVDEFRTTKLCLVCFRELEQPTKKGRMKKKYRYYKCRGCVKVLETTKAVMRIHSRISNRFNSGWTMNSFYFFIFN